MPTWLLETLRIVALLAIFLVVGAIL